MTGPRIQTAPHLTDQQTAVLLAFARGQQPGKIATALGISVHTVRTYLRAIFVALNAENLANAVGIACALNLLDSDQILQGGPHAR
ncbi:helix-turn-helix transcriptional regulator [Kitasatospora sp. NPDC047058]|uniref:helix-turn-helix domain-containing protein n=1 Tax=Kitasatospora sp. NPDC047058 TaxID=3155620 RepID=UPI0033D32AF7